MAKVRKFKVKYVWEDVVEVDEGHSDESDEANARYFAEDDIYSSIGGGHSSLNGVWEITEIE